MATSKERLAAGKCGACGVRPFRKGRTTCERCAEYQAEYQAKARERRRNSGMCNYCEEPAVGYSCERHTRYFRERARVEYWERRRRYDD